MKFKNYNIFFLAIFISEKNNPSVENKGVNQDLTERYLFTSSEAESVTVPRQKEKEKDE